MHAFSITPVVGARQLASSGSSSLAQERLCRQARQAAPAGVGPTCASADGPSAPAASRSFVTAARSWVAAAALAAALIPAAPVFAVNRPDLLPKEKTPVIDLMDYLSPAQERKLAAQLTELDAKGFKIRVLTQSYPETPGESIKEFWGLDDSSIVMVVDDTFPNRLNFNVGQEVQLLLPQSFWTRLKSDYGNKTFTKGSAGELEKDADAAIFKAVRRIENCLLNEGGTCL
eukprot:tig00021128_g18890.t1